MENLLNSPEVSLQLLAWLPVGVDDCVVSQRAARFHVEAALLSTYAMSGLKCGGLVLGYAAFRVPQLHEGVRRL